MRDAEKVPDITEVYAKIKEQEAVEEQRAEAEANTVNRVLNHRKLYKAMKRLDDLECC